MPNLIDLTGRRFGRLEVLRRGADKFSPKGRPQAIWTCRCACGAEKDVWGSALRRGLQVSCGCYQRQRTSDRLTKHGESWSKTRREGRRLSSEYSCWQAMIRRCENGSDPNFANYGGRGIKVCDRWRRDFLAFVENMGRRPSPQHSIDRIDVNGNYEPGNCRWANASEQARNRRNVPVLSLDGEVACPSDWADRTGIPAVVIRRRIRHGWSTERALKTPYKVPKVAVCVPTADFYAGSELW